MDDMSEMLQAMSHQERKYDELLASHERLKAAVNAVVDIYVELVDSGDAGFWDAEEVGEVIRAHEALKLIPKGE